MHRPKGTLAAVRNEAASIASGEWLCFLDGDDELDERYIEAMREQISDFDQDQRTSTGQIRPELFTPRVSYVRKGRVEAPKFWRVVPLETQNWLVIGTLLPKAMFEQVGGFQEWPIYEDWALFAACYKAGARVVQVQRAVYIAHWHEDSRNKSLSKADRVKTQYEIGNELFPEHYGEQWLAKHLRNAARTTKPPRRTRVRQ